MNKILAAWLEKFGVKPPVKGQRMPVDVFTATRTDLADLLQQLQLDRGVEVGVRQGEYSEVLLRANPRLHLLSVDPWLTYKGYRDHVRQDRVNAFEVECRERLRPWTESSRCEIVKAFSTDAVQAVAPNSLDFCYLDGNHSFDFIAEDLIAWGRRVRSGGIIAGHDYIRRRHEPVHVVQAVQAYTYCHGIKIWFTVGGESRETRSFWFIKP